MSKLHSYSPVKAECDVSIVKKNDENSNNNLEENYHINLNSISYSNYNTITDFETLVQRCSKCNNYETFDETSLVLHLTTCQEIENNNEKDLQANSKLFICNICNKQFKNSTNLSRHKRRHTGDRKYECKVCQKRFFRKDHLSVHFIKIHRKSFYCTICNRGFQQQDNFIIHIQNEHDNQFDIIKSCQLCNFRSNSIINMRIHIFNRHDIDPDNFDIELDVISSTSTNHTQINPDSGNFSTSGDYNDDKESMSENHSESNATPPIDLLTPYVEISMIDSTANCSSSFLQTNDNTIGSAKYIINNDVSLTDSNSNISCFPILHENNQQRVSTITPHVSCFLIKKDQGEEFLRQNGSNNQHSGETQSSHFQPAASLSSLIKASPLESLFCDELRLKNNINIIESSQAQPHITNPSQWSYMIIKKSLQCSFCDIIFPDQTLYALHERFHSETNPWKCNFCGKQCSNVYEFNFHLLNKNHQW